ncbi:hypothetical protein EJ05DRAFT_513023 [Pseudovirgaria hyperparasitica]|uniref:Mitochondrial import inner membrane translocase subunit TIM50 n=1 Tax=Pseudovirgaria hyperparasitica TaxID=470096 RepID=A0A6A6W1R7_9PEZI|nr:uncharacterized protein EJ05DRAFT_513023 [Pseudovirgaria hyperparasitica]KAF2755517.1 hypothetical protein EJ05DRAFT_513023 [Pseudovirgaria hyperparasitica]
MLSRSAAHAIRSGPQSSPTTPLRYYSQSAASGLSRSKNARRAQLMKEYRQAYEIESGRNVIQLRQGMSSLPALRLHEETGNNASIRYARPMMKRNLNPPSPPQYSRKSKPTPAAELSEKQAEFGGPKSAKANEPDAESVKEPVQEHASNTGPLPDLRHGIPSTFAKEFGAQANARAELDVEHSGPNVTEDPENPAPPPGSGGRGGAELPKSAYETSTDRRRNRTANYSAVAAALLGIGGAVYYGRDWDTEEEAKLHPEAPSGWDFSLFWKRINARWSNQMSYYTEPTFPKLLPDLDPAPPYTLVLSLEDLLIHSEWSREHGWRTAKRPGLDYFLRYLCQYYEIVVFTSLPRTSAEPIVAKLDPLRLAIAWPLYREGTRYENGEYIKDLSYLNRDPSKVILIDTKKDHAKLQPNNAIILPPWEGKAQDKGLVNLIPFLEYLAAMGIPDVRAAIKSFEGTDIPTEFARREAIQREAFNKQLAAENAKKPKRSASSWVAGALGMKPQQGGAGGLQYEDGQSLAEGARQGKMLSDQARERGQRQYELMEKEIRENSEKWTKELEEMEKAMQEDFVKGMKQSFSVKSLLGLAPKEEQAKQQQAGAAVEKK